jgi:hypothetical protein
VATEAPSNPGLADAARAALEGGPEDEARLRAFLSAFAEATLIAADDNGWVSADVDGEDYLALFTDLIELYFFEPGLRWTAVRASDAIAKVIAGDYDGLVLDAGPRQIELSREDVLDFFELT